MSTETTSPGTVAPSTPPGAQTGAGRRPLVLVVDDSEDIRALLGTLLKRRYEVRLAADGLPAEHHRLGRRAEPPANGVEERALPRPVRPDDGDGLALVHSQVDPEQRLEVAIARGQAARLQQRRAHSADIPM